MGRTWRTFTSNSDYIISANMIYTCESFHPVSCFNFMHSTLFNTPSMVCFIVLDLCFCMFPCVCFCLVCLLGECVGKQVFLCVACFKAESNQTKPGQTHRAFNTSKTSSWWKCGTSRSRRQRSASDTSPDIRYSLSRRFIWNKGTHPQRKY